MKKPIVVLVVVLVLGAASVLFATGKFGGVIDKILNRQEVSDTIGKDKDLDGALEKIKGNLDKVGSVKGAVRQTFQVKYDDNDLSSPEEAGGSMEFVFPDKKVISGDWGGGQLKSKIIGDGVYKEISWLSELHKKSMEQKGFSTANPSDWEAWYYGKDGHSMQMPIPDSPGEYINFNLSDYAEGWDFTRNIEKITEYLGTEEINGVKCSHYKVQSKKPSPYIGGSLSKTESYFLRKIIGLEPVAGPHSGEDGSKMEEEKDGIRQSFRGYEVLIPFPDSLTMPRMFRSVALDAPSDDPTSWSYEVDTWAIEGEIWVGEDDFLVHKESYATETSRYYYSPKVDGKKVKGDREIVIPIINKNKTEIIYSDFNAEIEINAPDKFVVVDTNAHDMQRKEDLKDISVSLENIAAQSKRPTVTPYPDTGNKSVKVNSDDFLLNKLRYEFPHDPLDPEHYYTYKSDGYSYSVTARLEDLENKECDMVNDMCLYSLEGVTTKPDPNEVQSMRNSCNGTLQLLEQKCKDNKLQLKMKIEVSEECPPVSSIAIYGEGKSKGGNMLPAADKNQYLINFEGCDNLKSITVASARGFIIGDIKF